MKETIYIYTNDKHSKIWQQLRKKSTKSEIFSKNSFLPVAYRRTLGEPTQSVAGDQAKHWTRHPWSSWKHIKMEFCWIQTSNSKQLKQDLKNTKLIILYSKTLINKNVFKTDHYSLKQNQKIRFSNLFIIL